VVTSHLADQEEIRLAEVGRELLDASAEVAPGVGVDVLEGVDAEPIAIRERHPVLITASQIVERARPIEVHVAQPDEVCPPELRVRVVEAARSEASLAGPRVNVFGLELPRPHAVCEPDNRVGEPSVSAAPSPARVE